MPARSSRLVFLLALATVLSQANLGHVLGPLTPNIVAVQLTFDSQAFWQAMAQWGPEGIQRFRATTLPWDMLHPFIYGAFGHVLVTRSKLFQCPRPDRRAWLAWALPVAGACDLGENFCALYLLSLPWGTPSALVPVSATFSALKWGLAAGFAVLVPGLAIRRLFNAR